jgi:hypothetical protein
MLCVHIRKTRPCQDRKINNFFFYIMLFVTFYTKPCTHIFEIELFPPTAGSAEAKLGCGRGWTIEESWFGFRQKQDVLSPPKGLDQLWGPPESYSMIKREICQEVSDRNAKLTNRLRLMWKLRII